jgi:hypothetical protein
MRTTQWLLLGATFGLFPMAASFPTTRLLAAAEVAFAVMLASVANAAWESAFTEPRRPMRAALIAVVFAPIAWQHVVIASRRVRSDSIEIRSDRTAILREIRLRDLTRTEVGNARVVLIAAPDQAILLEAPMILHLASTPLPRSWWVLSMSPGRHVLRRVSQDAIEIIAGDVDMMTSPMELFFRSSRHPLHVGEIVQLDGMRATVLQLGTFGVKRVRFEFGAPLEGPGTLFVRATAAGIVRVDLPAQGSAILVPPAQVPDGR